MLIPCAAPTAVRSWPSPIRHGRAFRPSQLKILIHFTIGLPYSLAITHFTTHYSLLPTPCSFFSPSGAGGFSIIIIHFTDHKCTFAWRRHYTVFPFNSLPYYFAKLKVGYAVFAGKIEILHFLMAEAVRFSFTSLRFTCRNN